MTQRGPSWIYAFPPIAGILIHVPTSTLHADDGARLEVTLIFVSAGIFYRAYTLRRRFRRQLEEAIAAGVLLPEQIEALRRREHILILEEPPKIWEMQVSKRTKGNDKWDEIMVQDLALILIVGKLICFVNSQYLH
jgi:hypothetical protein